MDTEIHDYSNESFSIREPPESVLYSRYSRVPNSGEGVDSSCGSQLSQEMGYVNYMDTTHNAQLSHGINNLRPFHRSHSQPMWRRQLINSSSADSSQSETNQSQLQLAKEKINELSKSNQALYARLDRVEGMLNAVMSSGFVPRSGPSTASPFLGSLSLAPSGSSLSVLSPLNREDYPQVKFWYRRDWSNYLKVNGSFTSNRMEPVRGKTLMSQGINKNAKYIEGPDGEPVDGYKLKDILSHARAVWANIHDISRAPVSWGKATAEVARFYRHEMRVKFSEFGLCENDWKADQLATDHYPSYYSNNIKGVEVKEEGMAGSKRSSIEITILPSKKMKKVRNPKNLNSTLEVSDETSDSVTPDSIVIEETPSVAEGVLPASSVTSVTIEPVPVNDQGSARSNAVDVLPSGPTAIQTVKVRNPLSEKKRESPTRMDMTATTGPAATDTIDMITTTVGTARTDTVMVTATATDTTATTGMAAMDTAVVTTTASDTTMVATTTLDTMAMVTTTATTAKETDGNRECPPLTPSSMSHLLSEENVLLDEENQGDPVPVPSLPNPVEHPVMVPVNLVEPATSTSGEENGQTAIQMKKGPRMRPNTSLSARNLCAQDWCAAHPDGSKAEFKHFYDQGISAEHKKMYEQHSKEAKLAGAKTSAKKSQKSG